MPESTTEPAAETLMIPAKGLLPAAPGTHEQLFGHTFTVQEDGSRVGEIPGWAVAGELAAGRMQRVAPVVETPAEPAPSPTPAAPLPPDLAPSASVGGEGHGDGDAPAKGKGPKR